MPPGDELNRLHQEILSCTRCPLSESRTRAVPGKGPVGAMVMFIGEGPGQKEDELGKPFVGRAGRILTEMLEAAGLESGSVFITSVVKCRPPGNRDPRPSEIEACRPYLDRQIELIDPDCIVTLGRFSMARWFPGRRIHAIHGRAESFSSRLVFPTFHPGAVLHQPKTRSLLEEDFHRLGHLLEGLSRRDFPAGDESAQGGSGPDPASQDRERQA